MNSTVTHSLCGARWRYQGFVLIAAMVALGVLPVGADDTVTITPKPQTQGLVRNPAMGWMLYLETGGDSFKPAENFWDAAEPYVGEASILYIRASWSLFEPQEGHYAWKEDANFQALVAGAQQRHLKLAFRVVANSKDCSAPATPLWVQAAGAQGYTEKGQGGRDLWTPTITDLVFRRKLENFIKAFAQEFDDPSRVDFIDGCGLGWWGEMDHLNIPSTECPQTLKWICETYSHSFHHVLLGIQINSELSQWGALDNIPLDDYGYVARRDGLGSSWLSEHDREKLSSIYPQIPFYGESCYFSLDSWDIWKKDRRHFETIHDVLQATFDDAMTYHANTLDLRAPHDAALWNKEAPDLVTSFITNAGYRLAPATIQYPAQFAADQPFTIQYTWRNLGNGVMPNDNPRWGKRYRVGFALLNVDSKKPVATAIDPSADPGLWVSGQDWPNTFKAKFTPAPVAGHYLLALAIVNTENRNEPEIQIAAEDLKQSNGWSLLGDVQVKAAETASAPSSP